MLHNVLYFNLILIKRRPPLITYPTGDIRNKLNCKRGSDNNITIAVAVTALLHKSSSTYRTNPHKTKLRLQVDSLMHHQEYVPESCMKLSWTLLDFEQVRDHLPLLSAELLLPDSPEKDGNRDMLLQTHIKTDASRWRHPPATWQERMRRWERIGSFEQLAFKNQFLKWYSTSFVMT